MALYNTFVIRQRIFKNAIHLTKSNNPTVVKFVNNKIFRHQLLLGWDIFQDYVEFG